MQHNAPGLDSQGRVPCNTRATSMRQSIGGGGKAVIVTAHISSNSAIIPAMCSGVEYRWRARAMRAYFANPQALLPVLLRSGEAKLLVWGRREDQFSR
jgi:hypothetical protein